MRAINQTWTRVPKIVKSQGTVADYAGKSKKGETARSQPEGSRTMHDFVRMLFRLLDEHDVRYFLLPSWDGLPGDVASDLGLAVHPNDAEKWLFVVQRLSAHWYLPLRAVRFAIKSWRYDFAWFDPPGLNCMAVDIIHDYQEGGLISTSGEAWLGDRAEKVAGQFFPDTWKRQIAEACQSGCASGSFARIAQPWWTRLVRKPIKVIRSPLADGWRRIRCWFRPTGIFIVALGPDGVGKSTVIKHLIEATAPAFRANRVFHWRPMSLFRRKHTGTVTDPHGSPQHSAWWSVARLFSYLLDYWLGYWWTIRPLLARSSLVVFDRYYYDLLIDPRRYRYGGPLWLIRLLGPLIPKPDLVFVLDAPDEVILSRKQEIEPQEVRRQRQCYVQLAGNISHANLVRTDQGIGQTIGQVSQALADHLVQRIQRQHADWAVCGSASNLDD